MEAGSTQEDLEELPKPKMTLFRPEEVELGYRDPGPGPGSGMVNMGNTCYINATLQVNENKNFFSYFHHLRLFSIPLL